MTTAEDIRELTPEQAGLEIKARTEAHARVKHHRDQLGEAFSILTEELAWASDAGSDEIDDPSALANTIDWLRISINLADADVKRADEALDAAYERMEQMATDPLHLWFEPLKGVVEKAVRAGEDEHMDRQDAFEAEFKYDAAFDPPTASRLLTDIERGVELHMKVADALGAAEWATAEQAEEILYALINRMHGPLRDYLSSLQSKEGGQNE